MTPSFTVTGPEDSVPVGLPVTLTVTPNEELSDTLTVTVTDGTVHPTSLDFSDSSVPQQVTCISTGVGIQTVTFESAAGYEISRSPFSFTIVGVDAPINSWNNMDTRIPSIYKFRGRYTRTRDPLPVMNYKQLEEALPQNYNLPPGRVPMIQGFSIPQESTESPEYSPPVPLEKKN